MKSKIGTRIRATKAQQRWKYRPLSDIKEGDDIFAKVPYIDVNIGDLGTIVGEETVMGEKHITVDWDNGSKCAYDLLPRKPPLS